MLGCQLISQLFYFDSSWTSYSQQIFITFVVQLRIYFCLLQLIVNGSFLGHWCICVLILIVYLNRSPSKPRLAFHVLFVPTSKSIATQYTFHSFNGDAPTSARTRTSCLSLSISVYIICNIDIKLCVTWCVRCGACARFA